MQKAFIQFFVILFCGNVSTAFSQEQEQTGNQNSANKKIYVGVSAGLASIDSDVALYTIIPKKNQLSRSLFPSGSVNVEYPLLKIMNASFAWQIGKVEGTKLKKGKTPTIISSTNYQTFTLSANIDLLRLLFDETKERRIYIKGSLGAGAIAYRSYIVNKATGDVQDFIGYKKVTEDSLNSNQISLYEKDKKKWTAVIPFGLSLGLNLSEAIGLYLEYKQINTTTDKLDTYELAYTKNDKIRYVGIGMVYGF